jgi:nucleotide-binding universal stress UspA family protein
LTAHPGLDRGRAGAHAGDVSEELRIEVVDDEDPHGPRVVVGVDCSAGSRAALLFGLADAVRRGVRLEAVTAYRPPDYWLDFDAVGILDPEAVRTAAVNRVQTFLAEVLREGPQPAPPVVLNAGMGGAVDVLLRRCHGADLLVVGSRGHGGLGSMLLGSTSMHCVLHATCPVTVVHSPEAHRERLHLHRGRHSAAG